MPNLQTNAELDFYNGINTITTLEIGELCKIEDEYYPGIEKSKNLNKRLSDLLTAFKKEIRDNLLLLSQKEKISRLKSHLKEANEYLQAYKNEYEGYLNAEPKNYWIKPHTHQKIIFIYKITEFLEEALPKTIKEKERTSINPLNSLDPALIDHFLKIEKKVCGENGKWGDSNIRLAAFCELLYEKRYFTVKPKQNKNRPLNFINDFSKSRYGIDIGTSLLAAKEREREYHKTNTKTKNKKPPLKNYFQ
jgi:hypothetical protein